MALAVKRLPTWSFINTRLFASASTVDIQEIEKFEKYASDWWDEFGCMRGLHAMNRARVPFIRDGIINEGLVEKQHVNTSTPLKGLSILDVGCGGGLLAEPLARLGANVTGIDATDGLVEVAKRHADKKNMSVSYLCTSIEDHFKDNHEKYDVVVASEIVEHVSEKQTFLDACSKCLKPNGSMFITTLNKSFLTNLLGIYLMENVIKFVPKGTHQIEKCIEPHKLQRMLEDCNLSTRLVHGIFYNVVTNNWSWCSDTSISYGLHAVKIIEENK